MKMKNKTVKGFKVTNNDMTCRNFQYELCKTFKHDGQISLIGEGFHFCLLLQHCFNYYKFTPDNKVFEIEASGKIIHGNNKSVCSEIRLIREIPWDEVLKILNIGLYNTGHSNSGSYNSGNRNSGSYNSGDGNSGYNNSGYRNSGHRNSGDGNSGYNNSGNYNSGHRNSGNWNSGHRNSGNWNSGHRNSGDSNSGYRNSGAFCTEEDPILYLFNKPTKMTVKEWENHEVYNLMHDINNIIWIRYCDMTDEEKKANIECKKNNGYLKIISLKEAWANFWNNLKEEDKKLFTSLPNFDSKIFKEITGIEIR